MTRRRFLVGPASTLVGVAGWLLIGYGLFLSTPDERAVDDLEAGGRFAANFAIYLPYVALSVVLLGIALWGLFATSGGPAAVVSCAVLGFAGWILLLGWLDAALPDLDRLLHLAVVLSGAVVVVLGTVSVQRRPTSSQSEHGASTGNPQSHT